MFLFSLESERAFSITGKFITKVRSHLGDDSVNALVFLKTHYQMKDQKKQGEKINIKTPKQDNLNARSQQETPHSSKSRPETQSKTPKPTSSRSDAETPKSSRTKFRFKNIPRNDNSEETDMSE